MTNNGHPKLGAVDLEIIKASLSGIVQEMQHSLFRTGFSTIVRESQDASCAIMDTDADVIAQHVVLPLHMGAFPACCGAVIAAYPDDIAEGDAFLINHPYEGGSPHAPDVAVITPIFFEGARIGFCGSIAHKSDIGGPVPGSCSGQARETFNEGLHLPAVRYARTGERNVEIERIIAVNSRTPELVLGDIRGQLGACRLGEGRVAGLVRTFGKDKSLASFQRLLDLAETQIRAAIAEWVDGRYEGERFIDDDGIELNKPVRIHVVVEKTGDRIGFDFSGSADQTRGPANVRPPLVKAAVGYALISLVDPLIFINSGIMRAFDVKTREGSVLNPRFPAPVNTYNATVHAMVESLFAALSDAVPSRARADGCGSRSVIIGGRPTSAGKSYVQYEIVGGGAGGRATKDGASGTSVNQSNAKIASIEIIESEFPTRVRRFELIEDSGGAGTFRGGLGILREYVNLVDARFSIRSSKHAIPPLGARGGAPGRTGDLTVNPGTRGETHLPTRYADYPLKAGDVFRLETPGGGGLGNPFAREPAKVLVDVVQGYVSPQRAARDYGVAVVRTGRSWQIDETATTRLRASAQQNERACPMSVNNAGVIGLGAMGFQMARHMVNKGFAVAGFDVLPEAMTRAKEAGVTVVADPAAVGAVADIVIVMVATDAQVTDVVTGSGLLDKLERGSVICISSSTSPETARELEGVCATRGIGLLDTPVVLGQEAADSGTLTVFCGGDASAFERAKPVLSAFGANVMHVGPSGMGQLTKTANNMLLWACLVANYEVLSLARKMGADVPKLIAALEHSSGANWSLGRWGRSTGKWAEKDMDVALELAQEAKVPVPLAALVDQLMKGMTREKMKALLS